LPHNHSCSLWLSPLWSLHKSKNTTLFHNPEHLISFMYLIQSLTRYSHKMSQSRLHRLFAWVLFFSGDILRSRISVLPTKSSNIQFFFNTAQSNLCSIYCAQFVSQISWYYYKYYTSLNISLSWLLNLWIFHVSLLGYILVRKDMNVNGHEASPLYTSDTN
jgi:hypothetical protein